SENPQAHLFLIDYETKQRIKIWGNARVVKDDDALIAQLMPRDYAAKAEQAIIFNVVAWDANCPQHIPQRFDADVVANVLRDRDRRIVELEAEVARLRAG
ncbi:MAG: pyridoxamine 5'-phosphate oxidase, partial [Betaproteobacteria bacterium]